MLYCVWGPDAEFGDGVGPKMWFLSKAEAREFIREEKRTLREEGLMKDWPYNSREFFIVERDPISVYREFPREFQNDIRNIGELLEYLNMHA